MFLISTWTNFLFDIKLLNMDLFHQRKKTKTNLDMHILVTCTRSQKSCVFFNSKTLRQMQYSNSTIPELQHMLSHCWKCEKSDISLIFKIVLLYFKAFKCILYLLQLWVSLMWNAKFDAFISTFLPLVLNFFEVYLYAPGALTGNLYFDSNTMQNFQISKNIFDHAWNVKLKVDFNGNLCLAHHFD